MAQLPWSQNLTCDDSFPLQRKAFKGKLKLKKKKKKKKTLDATFPEEDSDIRGWGQAVA
jgi:hypothetical protein